MNSVFSWLPADGWQRLTCDALWQSTLLGAIGFLTARFFIRQAAARAWLLLMALTACAVAPLASLAAREQGWTLFHAPQQSVPDNLETYNGAASNQAATTQRFDRAAAETDRIEFNYSAKADLLRSTEVFNSNAQPSAKSSLSPGPSIDSTRSRSSAATVFNVFGIAWLCLSSALALRLALSFATAYRLLLSSVARQRSNRNAHDIHIRPAAPVRAGPKQRPGSQFNGGFNHHRLDCRIHA